MKLLRFRVHGFGPIDAWDTGDQDDLPGLVAVLGSNEAGKSSVHQAIVALLYGFYPASRDRNPLSPWSGKDPELEGWIETREGEALHLHRRLLSSPRAQLRRGDRVEELRNRELPAVGHVSKEVFGSVYALTLGQLTRLEAEGRSAVQDRLVVGMGTDDLRSPREAAKELEDEAGAIWRPTRRGNQRIRVLRKEVEKWLELSREARDRDRESREIHGRIPELEEELEALTAEEHSLEVTSHRIGRLRPLAGRLEQLEELARTAGRPEELERLPPDPASVLQGLEERLEEAVELRTRLEMQLEDAQARADGINEEESQVRAAASTLRPLADRAPLLQEYAVRRGQAEGEVARLQRRLREVAAPIFEGEGPARVPGLSQLAPDELRERLEAVARVERRLEAARDALARAEGGGSGMRSDETTDPPGGPGNDVLAALGGGAVLLLLGVALLVLTGGTVLPWHLILLAMGVALLGWGAVTITRRRVRREAHEEERARARSRIQTAEEEIRALEGELQRARSRVKELLASLPLRSQVIQDPPAGLPRELERLQALYLDLEAEERRLAELTASDQEIGREVEDARKRFPSLEDLPSDPISALPELGRRLDELARRDASARSARKEVERIQEELERVQGRIGELEKRRTTLVEAIRAAGNQGPIEHDLQRVQERLQAAASLARARDELRRDRPDLLREQSELRAARDANEDWLHDPEARTRLEARRRELGRAREALREEVATLRERARHLAGEETPDMVAGRIQALRDEIEELSRVRDRSVALARVIQVAELRFREAHQPDLLRRAGEYLDRITEGRYRRLLLSDTPGQDPFVLDAEHLPRALAVKPPISTGTREQIYLALRLAIVDHLEADREPLPLFLDEVFVNWDQDRRDRGLDLLAGMDQDRQIFLFTCHPPLARGVERRGGRILRLAGPGDKA